MRFYRSDWIGTILGLALGSYQLFVILNKPIFPAFNSEALIPVIVSNLFLMIIAYGVSTGIVGMVYHSIIGLPSQAIIPIVFFGAAGFGFLGAYYIHPELAYRSSEKA